MANGLMGQVVEVFIPHEKEPMRTVFFRDYLNLKLVGFVGLYIKGLTSS